MYAVREALAAIRRAPVLTALSAAMVALALFVVGLFGLVTFNLHQALARVEERVEVIAYIRDGAQSEEVAAAQEVLLELTEVSAVKHVSKDEALRLAREDVPEFQEIFRGLEINPLPASLEDAMECLKRDKVARSWLPESLYETFVTVKEDQIAEAKDLNDEELCARYAQVY